MDLRRTDHPTALANVTPRDDPRTVHVLGQPGAGKLLATRMVQRTMRTGTTRLVGDDFKASHPDYFQLLCDDPRSAGAAIRTDYRARSSSWPWPPSPYHS
ncbi:zeta toxin family protein [Streptomyces sp. NPDC002078]